MAKECRLLTCISSMWYATIRTNRTTVEMEMRVFNPVDIRSSLDCNYLEFVS